MIDRLSAHLSGVAKPVRRIVGCMTGTSLDGLDAALVEVEGAGLSLSAKFVRGISREIGAARGSLQRLASGEPLCAGEIARAARELSLTHAAAISDLLSGGTADFAAIHGQTIFHKPPLSWQLFNPAVVAAETALPVVSDFRSLDVARGGEGAPITPLADFLIFRSEEDRRAVVNLGGFVNFTDLPAGRTIPGFGEEKLNIWKQEIRGGDVCVCNQLLDRAARLSLGREVDADGDAAMGGNIQQGALVSLFEILSHQATAGKSLGSGDEAFGWLENHLRTLVARDLLRTICAAIAAAVALRLPPDAREVVIAGGGVNNRALRLELEDRAGARICIAEDFGWTGAYREAAAMALLGALAADGFPITLRAVTGAVQESGPACWTLL